MKIENITTTASNKPVKKMTIKDVRRAIRALEKHKEFEPFMYGHFLDYFVRTENRHVPFIIKTAAA